MRRLRLVGAGVAVLTALIDWLLARDPATPGSVVALVALAAACLVAFTPFEALEPPGRKLVVAACFLYVGGILAALVLAAVAAVDGAVLAALAALATIGVGLAIWAFSIRRRRRRSGWRNYYES